MFSSFAVAKALPIMSAHSFTVIGRNAQESVKKLQDWVVRVFNDELRSDHRVEDQNGDKRFGLWDTLTCSEASNLVKAIAKHDDWISDCITRGLSAGALFRCEGNESKIKGTPQKAGPFRG